jgi:hypothetical protein
MISAAWPSLDLHSWQDTQASLHLRTQIVGKTRLALAPMQNHWWQTPLYITARGLTTSPMPYKNVFFDVDFDFIDHRLIIKKSDGVSGKMQLRPQTIADFYQEYIELLHSLRIDVSIWPHPVESAGTIPFAEDKANSAYDRKAVERLFRVLLHADGLLKEFRASFLGKCSPSHFWWGSFDIACTRFSGKHAPRHPGGVPNMADWVTREAYSHECISAGWWPGTIGSPIEEPAFYAYAYPEPVGCSTAAVKPDTARYDMTMREWILPYSAVVNAQEPDTLVREFLQNAYDTASQLGSWSPDLVRAT